MVAYAKKQYVTPQQYLTLERDAETKSEYRDGEIVAMAGAGTEHNRIAYNINGHFHFQLRGKACLGFSSDTRIRIPKCNRYYYPDGGVTCEPPLYEDVAGVPSLLNPTLIVEVLSPSTEAYDRGEKWECYQTLESLKTYILVAQDRPHLEIFIRQEDGSWEREIVEGLEATIYLESIGCDLPLDQAYASISWLFLLGEE